MTDAINRLHREGVSVWLDEAGKAPIPPPALYSMVESDQITGLTAHSPLLVHAHCRTLSKSVLQKCTPRVDTPLKPTAVHALVADDVRRKCDMLLGVYRRTGGREGYVSIDIDPHHAHDAPRLLNAVLTLHAFIDRPNVLVGVPATDAGILALSECIANGIGVHATLIFSINRYRQVIAAYLKGLETAHGRGYSLEEITSIASFHIDELDAAVNGELTKTSTPEAKAMMDRAGLANACLAYEVYEEFTSSLRWRKLATHGARTQRLLWCPTPYRQNTRYVEELVTQGTIMNMQVDLIQAVTDHAQIVGDRVRRNFTHANRDLDYLQWFGVSASAITQQLEHRALCAEQIAWQEASSKVNAHFDYTQGLLIRKDDGHYAEQAGEHAAPSRLVHPGV